MAELWDAYDQEGRPLGFDLVRGEPFPPGAWHLVAEVCPVTTDGRVLLTQRHPEKAWGLLWEITGGAVLKGESPVAGAARELQEETGITLPESSLHPVYVQPRQLPGGFPAIYHSFLAVFDPDTQAIRLQAGETVDYRLMPYKEFLQFMMTEHYISFVRQRFLDHQAAFDRLMAEHIGK